MFFFFQAEDGIRDLVRSRGLGDVYKRQALRDQAAGRHAIPETRGRRAGKCSVPSMNVSEHLSLIHI